MPGEFPSIEKHQLFASLASGHAAGITVVTPNRRLAQVLKSEFDSFQSNKNLAVWDDADILPVSTFVERLYEDALYADGAADLPRLLAPVQEHALWEAVLAGQPLLSVGRAAADCADAWRLAHAWRIEGAAFSAAMKFLGNEDTQAYAGWAQEYQRRVDQGGFVDAAALTDVVLKHAGKKPKLLVAYGFDILPPQTRKFFTGFEVLACRAATKNAQVTKIAFPSAHHELEAAAQWARTRLEAGATRIGVVVPGLQLRRKEVVRVFSNVLHPGWNVPRSQADAAAAGLAMPFDISIGELLEEFPLVSFALGILDFAGGEISFESVSQLMRSPFIGGAQAEFAARAVHDATLRGKLPPRLTLPRLISAVAGCPVLRSSLENLFTLQNSIQGKENTPFFWAQHFTALLEAAGFPGERTLDGGEFQARAKFNEALADLARLGLVSGRISCHQALRQLRRICADTLFQPQTPTAPIQVAGILESAGLSFDCLWVSGLSEDAWPLAVRAHPFLPVALQKQAGIPAAAAETSLALDRRITEGWLGAATEVVFSYPEREKDRDLLPSPLIASVPEGKVEFEEFLSWRLSIFQSRKIENIADGQATPLNSATLKGGTRVLADQAACPFRAFARHRLGAQGLETPTAGLDALERGQLLHALMAGIWKELKTSASLSGEVMPAIEKSAANAVKELGLEGRFAEMEKQRLICLAGDWLELERLRQPFEVVQIEETRALAIGGLSFSGRIDRMDRLLEGEARGSHVLIDYKTGRATPNSWLGERPDEPQLPLYVVTAKEPVSAVAFAKLQPGDMKFAGFSLQEKEIPGVKQAKSWSGLMASWQAGLLALASGFAGGDARVDPKRGLQTCRHCDLQPLCRVYEQLNALVESEEEEGE
ncbi:MAG: PD-(D/E)XK nuclease family protein [Betaproteobacteria bacterium]|nr:PD-(D/E)XK nuclease family protein [Betaproteobacteria bacterium]